MENMQEPKSGNFHMEEVEPSDVFIVVLGTTGAGKSTFVSRCTGEPLVNVGHKLESFTMHTRMHSMQRNGKTVHLVDTPGFADSHRSEDEVFKEIAYMLIKAHQFRIRLSAIIYLHPLTENRMRGTARRALKLLKTLCGPEACESVIFAAMQSEAVPLQQRRDRLEELKSSPQFWLDFCKAGSIVVEPNDTTADALSIIDIILARGKTYTLRFQEQACEQGRTLPETDAGREVLADLTEEERELLTDNAKLQRKIEELKKGNGHAEDEVEQLRETNTTLQLFQGRKGNINTTSKALISEGDARVQGEQLRLRERVDQLDAYVRDANVRMLVTESAQKLELQRQVDVLLAERANVQNMVQFKSMKYAKTGAVAGVIGAGAGIGQLVGCNVM